MKSQLMRVVYTMLILATVTLFVVTCSASAVWGS